MEPEPAVRIVPACETVPVGFDDEPVRLEKAVPVALAAIREDGEERVVNGGDPPDDRAVEAVLVCNPDDIVRGREVGIEEMPVGAAELTVTVRGRENVEAMVAVRGRE